MSLKSKLLIGMGVALAVSIAAGVVLAINVGKVNRAMNEWRGTHQASHEVFELNLLTSDYLLYHEPRAVAQWRLKYQDLLYELGVLDVHSREEQVVLDHMRRESGKMNDLFSQLVANYELSAAGGVETALSQEREARWTEQLLVSSQELVYDASRLNENAVGRLNSAQQVAAVSEAVLIALILCVVALASALVVRMVIKPISALKLGTEALARGDLDYRVGLESGDELGELSRSFDGMARELKGLLLSLEGEIEERRRAEAELERHRQRLEEMVEERTADLEASERTYRTISENIPMSIFLKDRESVYVSCNSRFAREQGIPPQEIAGKADYDFFPEELAEKYREDDRRIMESGVAEELEESYEYGGRKTTVQTIKTPARDEGGKVIGVFGMFWDISERKRMEEALQSYADNLARSNQELEAFAHTLSHDLRSSLSVIEGFSNSALEAEREGNRNMEVECLKHVIGGVRRVQGYIEALLQYARADQWEGAVFQADAEEVLLGVLMDFGEQIMLKGVEIETNIPLPPLQVSPVKLQQVFMNLIANALKYLGDSPKPRIEIGGSKEGKTATLYVSDNGVGIPEQLHQEIFHPFKRFSVDGGHGIGIGLATVARAVGAWGGRVWVESRSGQGATFYFTAPVAD